MSDTAVPIGDGHAVVLIPLDDLVPHPDNPKAHDLGVIRESLRRFGLTVPVLVDGRSGYIVAGHGRREALMAERAEGTAAPAGVVVDGTVWKVPVITGWSSTDDDELRRYLIADNRTTIVGGWNNDVLAEMLEKLRVQPDGLRGVGYSSEQVADLLKTIGSPPTLEQVAGSLGPAGERDLWPDIHFRVPPSVKARYDAIMLAAKRSDDPPERFEWLIGLAEASVHGPGPQAADGGYFDTDPSATPAEAEVPA